MSEQDLVAKAFELVATTAADGNPIAEPGVTKDIAFVRGVRWAVEQEQDPSGDLLKHIRVTAKANARWRRIASKTIRDAEANLREAQGIIERARAEASNLSQQGHPMGVMLRLLHGLPVPGSMFTVDTCPNADHPGIADCPLCPFELCGNTIAPVDNGGEWGACAKQLGHAGRCPDVQPTYIDIVFDGPPEHESGRFVEVENADGVSIQAGEWVQRSDGYFALRIQAPTVEGQR